MAPKAAIPARNLGRQEAVHQIGINPPRNRSRTKRSLPASSVLGKTCPSTFVTRSSPSFSREHRTDGFGLLDRSDAPALADSEQTMSSLRGQFC